MIIGDQLQENSLDGNSLPTFTDTGVPGSGSLGSTLPQSRRKVQNGKVTMIVGGRKNSSAVCLKGGQVLVRFFVCNSVQDVRPSPLGFVVFCTSGLIYLYNGTCHQSESFNLRPYSTVAVLSSSDNVTSTAYIRHGALVTYVFGGRSIITLYTSSEITSTFGSCSSKWLPRTYNDTHFILDCPTMNKRFMLDGFISNSNKAVPTGLLFVNTGEDKAVIITGDRSISYYWKAFTSHCIINFPQSVSLLTDSTIDFGKKNDHTVIVLFNSDDIFVYDTGRGCRDEYLIKLNNTYPCVTGDCDGYYILNDGCILAVNNRSSNKLSLDLFCNFTATPHVVTNLQELPDVLNVNKSQIHVSPQISSMTSSSQTMTSSSSTISSLTSSLSITTSISITSSSTTSTSSSLLPSSITFPSPTPVSNRHKVSHAIYVTIIAIILGIIITIIIVLIIVITYRKYRKHKKTTSSESPRSISRAETPSTDTSSTNEPIELTKPNPASSSRAETPSTGTSSIDEPIELHVSVQESGLTTEPVPESQTQPAWYKLVTAHNT